MATRHIERTLFAAGALTGAFVVGRRSKRAALPSQATAAAEADDIGRYNLAKVAYDQVLDATKHQDDKVGRFLTAVAFLTAAAITFGTRNDVLGVQYNLDGLLPLPAILFAAFFPLVVVSVVFLLMALGQALGLPRASSPAGKKSFLFFLAISEETQDQWIRRWESPTANIHKDLTENLILETYNIATRADRKYQRTGEAQAIFTVALLLFGLAIALAINVLARHAQAPAEWDLRSRLVASTVLTSFAISLGYGWVRSEQKLVVGPGTKSRWPSYAVWSLASVLPLVVLVPPRVVSLRVGAAIAAAIVLTGGLSLSRKIHTRFARRVVEAASFAWALGTGFAVWEAAERWRLGLVLATVALFEVPRMLSATSTWRRRTAATEAAEQARLQAANDGAEAS